MGFIILYMCTINDNQMIYRSWGMEYNEQNLLSFWTLLCTFTPTVTTWKIKLLKKMEKTLALEILSFYKCVPYVKIIGCMVPDIWIAMDIIFCHFGPFWAFYPTNHPKNKNLKKKGKNPGDTIILHMCLINDRHFCHLGLFFAHLPP